MKDFFSLKLRAQNMGAHYIQEFIIYGKIWYMLSTPSPGGKEVRFFIAFCIFVSVSDQAYKIYKVQSLLDLVFILVEWG